MAEILAQISTSKALPPPLRQAPPPLPPPLPLLPPPGQSLREVAFKPGHGVGRYFSPEVRILRPRDLCAWDQQRAISPVRTWSCKGAICELYDHDRAGKPHWQPTNWAHTGEAFPPKPALLSERLPDTLDKLDSIAAQSKLIRTKNEGVRSAAARRPATAPQVRPSSARSGTASARGPVGASQPAAATGSRPSSARSGLGSRSKLAQRPSSPARQASPVRARPASAQRNLRAPQEPPKGPPPLNANNEHAEYDHRALSGRASFSGRPNSARSGRPNSARSCGRPASARSNKGGYGGQFMRPAVVMVQETQRR